MVIKKILSLLLISIGCAIFAHPSQDITTKLNQNNTVITWDLHDTLVKADTAQIKSNVSEIIKNDPKLVCLLFWPPFYYRLYKYKKESSNTEELLIKLSEKYTWLKPHWDKLIKTANLHNPIKDTVNILKDLKKRNYKNYLASNIGEQSLEIAKETHKEIFDQFDGIYMPAKIENSNFLISKPSIEYFNGMRSYLELNGQKSKSAIFIDDKDKNVKGANSSNKPGLMDIIGIRYIASEQLKNELQQKLTLEEIHDN